MLGDHGIVLPTKISQMKDADKSQMAVSENGVFTMGFNHPPMAIWRSGKNVETMMQTNTVTLNLFIPVLSSFLWKSCEM